MSKALKEAGYYKGKGVVEKVLKHYVAQISMLDGGDVLQIDQAELETVLPQEGGSVVVLRDPHRGSKAVMMGIDTAAYKAKVRLRDGKEAVLSVPYEDVCKLSSV